MAAVYRVARVGVMLLAAGALIGCTPVQSRIPGEEFTLSRAAKISGASGPWRDEMKIVQTPNGIFRIDEFEMAEIAPGDFFAVRNQMPKVAVTWNEARAACLRFGKRLCTKFEWQNACLGIHRRARSYGKRYEKSRCNVQSSGPARNGENQHCKNDYELYDMIGNVMEWVSDQRGQRAVAMGGSFRTGGRTDCFTAYYFPPTTRHEQVGFRCCK